MLPDTDRKATAWFLAAAGLTFSRVCAQLP